MKGTAYCTCKHCGKQFTKIFVDSGKGASDRIEEKVKWAENGGIDTCPECYAAQVRAKEQAQGLTCDVCYDKMTFKLYAIFEGDTYAHKDVLKAAGCKWSDDYPQRTKKVNGITKFIAPKKTWIYIAPADKKEEIEKILATLSIEATWPKRKANAEITKAS